MRVTVVKPDGVVCIDGLCFGEIDMTSVPPDVVALQWYETYGDQESINPITKRMENTIINSLDGYENVIAQWEQKKAEHDALSSGENS